MTRTKIEWAHFTVNFWWGCTKVSPACAHCYAETIAKIFSRGKATWGAKGARWVNFESATAKLGKVLREAKRKKFRPRIFVNSMSDTFEDNPLLTVPRCMALVLMGETSGADFLLLTKRPENILRMVPPAWLVKWPAHIWVGTTVENQACADERIPHLLQVPARVRFLSCEPLLGPVSLPLACKRDSDKDGNCDHHPEGCPSIGWVICGGESGGGARPTHPEWARSLRDQCEHAAVPFFFKQWGEWFPMPEILPEGARLGAVIIDGRMRKFMQMGRTSMVRLGKKQAGRKLDGRVWNKVPS
jgi:protein gp37